MKEFWQSLAHGARLGLAAGAVAIVLVMALAGWWLLRTEYQVLFADLKPQDAAVMTAELERLKIPYQLGDNGTALLVDKAHVHATRIKLMGKDLPLNGAVGFELFNNTDFGMTEFAQKINYQRALQGELTRTILSLAEVRDARVHLALPEQGLFKQATSKSKASITLTLRQGQSLRAEQVSGIQRLVAAAVPGMTTQEVTILDNQGVALSRAGGDTEPEANGMRLDLKRETENYLSRKAGAVLERTFGPGQALASVDVALNMDQVKVTTEDVIAAPQARGGPATGVVVRERESARDVAAPLDARMAGAGGSPHSGTTQREVEYQVGRRVEQVVSQPGSIRRIHVVAVVRRALDARQEEQVRKLVAAAVGASPERGDAVVVQALDGLPVAPNTVLPPVGDGRQEMMKAETITEAAPPASQYPLLIALLIAGVALAGLVLVLARRRASSAAGYQPMTESQRAAALQRVQDWMQQGAAPPGAPARTGSGT